MIAGIGTDLTEVSRFQGLLERHGERIVEKILAPAEQQDFLRAADKSRFLAKRFAAKEAFGKALGTGVVAPATLTAIAVTHDALGKPGFDFAPPLQRLLTERKLIAHLSISDEKAFALAFVVLEKRT